MTYVYYKSITNHSLLRIDETGKIEEFLPIEKGIEPEKTNTLAGIPVVVTPVAPRQKVKKDNPSKSQQRRVAAMVDVKPGNMAEKIMEQIRSGSKPAEVARDLGISIQNVYQTVYKSKKQKAPIAAPTAPVVETQIYDWDAEREELVKEYGEDDVDKVIRHSRDGQTAEEILEGSGVDLMLMEINEIMKKLKL